MMLILEVSYLQSNLASKLLSLNIRRSIMSTKSLISGALATDRNGSLILSAERELGAFLYAVRQRFNSEVASRAGEYWLQAFERASVSSRRPKSRYREVTIAAASRLATDNGIRIF
jgi:hypothetical protein